MTNDETLSLNPDVSRAVRFFVIGHSSFGFLSSFGIRHSSFPGCLDVAVGPFEKRGPVRGIGVAAVVLAPGDFAVYDSGVDCGHGIGEIVAGCAEVFPAEQTVNGSGGDGSHEAAVLIHPRTFR